MGSAFTLSPEELSNRDLRIYANHFAIQERLSGESLDKRILQLVGTDRHITRQEMANRCGTQLKTVERHLKALGIVIEGPAKTGEWKVVRLEKPDVHLEMTAYYDIL